MPSKVFEYSVVMGLSDTMKHCESPRKFVRDCEEELGNLSHKKKKQRVSAVRDFPPGCGPLDHLNSLEAASVDEMYPPRRIVDGLRDFPSFCGVNAHLQDKNLSSEESDWGNEPTSSATTMTTVNQTDVVENIQPESEMNKHLDMSYHHNKLHDGNFKSFEVASRRMVVLGLIPAPVRDNKPSSSATMITTVNQTKDAEKVKLKSEMNKHLDMSYNHKKLHHRRKIVLGLIPASVGDNKPSSPTTMLITVDQTKDVEKVQPESEIKSCREKHLGFFYHHNKQRHGNFKRSGPAKCRVIVLGLMSASNSPRTKRKSDLDHNPDTSASKICKLDGWGCKCSSLSWSW